MVSNLGQHEEGGEGAVCLWSGSWGLSVAGIVSTSILQQEGLHAAVGAAVSLMAFT